MRARERERDGMDIEVLSITKGISDRIAFFNKLSIVE